MEVRVQRSGMVEIFELKYTNKYVTVPLLNNQGIIYKKNGKFTD